MITGVRIKKLKIIPDDRGRLMEIFRSDDDFFKKFGQVYMTTVKPGIVKAWHWHKTEIDYAAATYWYGRPGAAANHQPDPAEAARPVQYKTH